MRQDSRYVRFRELNSVQLHDNGTSFFALRSHTELEGRQLKYAELWGHITIST